MLDDVQANTSAARGRTRIKGTDPALSKLVDQIGRGYQPNEPSGRERMVADMQAELEGRRPSDANINDDFAQRLAGKVRRTPIRGRGQIASRWDDDPNQYRYHYSPEENFEGIQRRGFDPELKKGYSKGTHFMNSPNEYPAIGDNAQNVYRVRRDAVPDWQNVSDDDFYTQRRIPSNDVEVYTGTPETPGSWSRVSNAYGFGSNMKGIYDILASFMPGVLPQIQTPADWLIQYNLQNSGSSPWNPENQMGHTTLA